MPEGRILEASRLSYAESLERFKAMMAQLNDPYAMLRAHQIFTAIRLGAGRSAGNRGLLGRWGLAIRQYAGNMGLAFWSLIALLVMRLRGVGADVHYCVDLSIQGRPDPRSAYVRGELKPGAVVTLYHHSDAWASLRRAVGRADALYPEAWVRVLWPAWRALMMRPRALAADPMLALAHQEALYGRLYLAVLKALLGMLGTHRMVLLDDPRNMPVYCRAARECGVRTLGYMHGKFNAFHVGLTVESFDVYAVWSDYFRRKIVQMWGGGRYPGEVIVSGLTREGVPERLVKRRAAGDPLCVLWLDEDEVDLASIQPFFMRLAQLSGLKVVFRLKPRPASRQAAFPHWYLSTFPHDDQTSFWQSLVHHGADIVIGCHSTALLEAAMVGVTPLALETEFDYARDLGRDGVVLPCRSPDEMAGRIEGVRQCADGGRPPVTPAIEPFDPAVMPAALRRMGFALRTLPSSSLTDLPTCRS